MSKQDWTGVIEATYRIEQDEKAWVQGVADAMGDLVGDVGTFAMGYEFVDGDLRARSVAQCGGAAELMPFMLAGIGQNAPEFNRRAFRETDVASISELGGETATRFAQVLGQFGIADQLGINGRNLAGPSAFIAVMLPTADPSYGHSPQGQLARRIARHLAAGARLRLALEQAPSDRAILSPDGRVLHADGDAREATVRAALTDSARRMDTARTHRTRANPEQSVDLWRVLSDARFSLVERTESDGRRVIEAVPNRLFSDTPAPPALSHREQQVILLEKIGRSQKEIAYELGLAHSTVRVLLTRARRKLKSEQT